MDLEALLALLADVASLTDEELAQLDADLVAAADAILDGGDLSDDDLDNLTRISEATGAVRAESEQRSTAAEERAARAAELAQAIRGEQADPEGDPDAEGDPAADPPPEVDADAPPADAPVDPVPEPEAVAAAARRPVVGRVAARRPAAVAPRRPEPGVLPSNIADWGLVASANAPGQAHGAPIRDAHDLANAFISAIRASAGYRGSDQVYVPIVGAGFDDPRSMYGEARTLTRDAVTNIRKIRDVVTPAATSMDALRASGGICAPLQSSYDLPVMGSTARPVRDRMMVRFGADRGGVRTLPPPILDDLSAAVGFWTAANDEDPGSDGPATKPCLTFTCPEETDDFVYAVTQCLEYGNFRAAYFPEQVEAWMRLMAVSAARQAETRLLTAIGTGSTQITSGQTLGTSRDVLTNLDRALAAFTSRYRLDDQGSWTFGAPLWLRNQIRSDLTRQIPVGTVEETMAVADARIDALFASRGINPVWFLDGESGQVFSQQGAGALQGWPSTVVTYLYPTGTWLFLDGGQLNLGVVRDSTLNGTNDARFFAETMEGSHFDGTESYRIVMDTCPDGSTAATVDINPCATGS